MSDCNSTILKIKAVLNICVVLREKAKTKPMHTHDLFLLVITHTYIYRGYIYQKNNNTYRGHAAASYIHCLGTTLDPPLFLGPQEILCTKSFRTIPKIISFFRESSILVRYYARKKSVENTIKFSWLIIHGTVDIVKEILGFSSFQFMKWNSLYVDAHSITFFRLIYNWCFP